MATYYIILSFLLLSCIFESSNNRVKRNVIIFLCIFFTLFGGLRWKTGTDWDSYLDIFRNSGFDNIFTFDKYGNGSEVVEFGYVFLNALINKIFGEFYVFNLVEAAIIQFSLFYASRYFSSKLPIISYSFLLLLTGFFPIRSSLGLAVAFWGYKYIKEQKLLAFLIIMAITCSIHMKYIIFLPCYWIGKIRLKWFVFYVVYLLIVALYIKFQEQITILISLLGSNSATDKFMVYTRAETEGYAGLSYVGVAFNVFLMSIYLYIRKKKVITDERWCNGLLNMYLASICIYAMFSSGMGDLTRLATLFILPQVLLLVTSIEYFIHHRVVLFRLSAIFFFALYFVYRAYQTTHGFFFKDANVPYMSIFDYTILH